MQIVDSENLAVAKSLIVHNDWAYKHTPTT